MITNDKCAQRGTALCTLPLPPPRLPVLCQPALDTWSCSAGDRFLEPCQDPPRQASLYWDLYPRSKVWPWKGMVGVYIPMWDTGHVPAIAGIFLNHRHPDPETEL